MRFVDTHTHPHMEGYKLSEDDFQRRCDEAGVDKVVCVGTSASDSRRAIGFASRGPGRFASIGLHPHDASRGEAEKRDLKELVKEDKVVAIGECGLDYFYEHSPLEEQKEIFAWQLKLAIEHDLPLIFHVRNSGSGGQAFADFLSIVDNYRPGSVRGVVHSFTADTKTLEACLDRGLYIGLNGIMTFTRDQSQLEAAKSVPLEKLLLETDAPFLTPVPYRGKVNDSGHVRTVAEFLSNLRNETLEKLAEVTAANAEELFSI